MTAQRGDFGRLPFATGGRQNSRPFEARFPGICESCQEGFEKGEMVMYEDDSLVHADPDDCEAMPKHRRGEAVCPECFMVHAGDCL